jgi:hypothetical protein
MGGIKPEARPWKTAPLSGHGLGREDRVIAERDVLPEGFYLPIQLGQPAFDKGKVMAGNNGTQTDLGRALESCPKKTPGPVPAAVAQKIVNFPRAVQAELQEEPGVVKETWRKRSKRDHAAGDDLYLLGNIQAGFQDRG